MKTRLISIGLCQKYDLNNQTQHCSIFQLKNYFNNTLIHFTINSKKVEDYYATNYQYRGYEEQIFKLLPKGGYFSPLDSETQFYENDIKINENRIIERQPIFFVLLIPYPNLRYFNSHHEFGTSDWASNPYPFKNIRFNRKIFRKDKFSDYSLKTDLGGEIKINNLLNNHDTFNNFFNNNNYPLFIEDQDELITIINDLDIFYFNTLGFRLKLENISKILIPFFELTPREVLDLSNCKSYDLPF
jgi:hypothetical protein